jgi:hypothetical protein
MSSGPKFSTKPSRVRSVNVLNELADPLAELERAWRRNETSSRPDQQRIAGRLAQARQRTTHRRRAEMQPPRGARDAPLRQHCIERDQEVEIGRALASLSLSMLMPSLDTSIANTGLPTLAFHASFTPSSGPCSHVSSPSPR